MINLYALTSPNVIKIFIMLEECGLSYNIITVDVWKGDQFRPEFLQLNPNGKIPVIVDRGNMETTPIVVFESGAILMYLAEKTGRFLPREAGVRYEVLQWLMIQLTGIGPMFGQFGYFSHSAPKETDNGHAIQRFRTEVVRLYRLIEDRLAKSPWLGGESYSIADIASFPWLSGYDRIGLSMEDYPFTKGWIDTIASRPKVKNAFDAVERIKSVRDHADPDDLDRLYNRGIHANA